MESKLRCLIYTIGMLSLLVAVFVIGESIYIGYFADTLVVSEYKFGSEAMVSSGGWAYKSQANYFFSGVVKGMSIAVFGILAIYYCWRQRHAL